MKNSHNKYIDWDVYLLIPPDFFNHYHFYIRRAIALQRAGMNCQLLSFVPYGQYKSNLDRYQSIRLAKLIKIHYKFLSHIYLPLFVVKQLIKRRKIVLHILRVDANVLLILKKLAFLDNKVKIIYEFEGDASSEINYDLKQSKANTFRKFKSYIKSFVNLKSDILKASLSDGLILMSQEHKDLWFKRIKRKEGIFIFPSLPEKSRIYYDESSRLITRSNLNVKDKTVLIYIGNVVCSWQRLEAMCNFINTLRLEVPNILFLLVVPKSNLNIAQNAVSQYNIQDYTIIKSASSNEMYKYMSAADIGLYLRHHHKMNNIVTSGKLGEYLASGLPVISTGANASVLNRYMDKKDLLIGINDNLTITEDFIDSLSDIIKYPKSSKDRQKLYEAFYSTFTTDDIINNEYPNFIKNIIGRI